MYGKKLEMNSHKSRSVWIVSILNLVSSDYNVATKRCSVQRDEKVSGRGLI